MDVEEIKRAIKDIKPATLAEIESIYPEHREDLFSTALKFAKSAAPEYLAEIAAALEQLHGTCDFTDNSHPICNLSEEAAFIFEISISALFLEPDPGYIEQLARAIGTTADKLEAVGAKTKEAAKQREQQGDYPPGCAPSADEIISLPPLPKIDYSKGLLLPTSTFNRNITALIGAVTRTITLDIPRQIEERKSKRKIIFSLTQNGKPETVTPYDIEVENAISSLFEDGQPKVTTQIIFDKMNGLNGNHARHITAAESKAVEQSINKLRRLEADVKIITKYENDKEDISKVSGNVLDTFYWEKCFVTPKRKNEIQAGWMSSRTGLFFKVEQEQGNRLKQIQPEQLNLSLSGISITPLTQMIRRFCLEEISRIAAAPSHETHKNKFKLERFYTYDLEPTLTEVEHIEGKGVEIRPRQGETANEKSKIRMAKKHRRELLQDILEHLKNTGALNGWDFVDKDKKIPFTLVKDEAQPKKKRRKYAPADIAKADGVVLKVTKTNRTISRIANMESRHEKNEKNERRTQKKSR